MSRAQEGSNPRVWGPQLSSDPFSAGFRGGAPGLALEDPCVHFLLASIAELRARRQPCPSVRNHVTLPGGLPVGHLLRQASSSVPHPPCLPIPGIAVAAVCLEFARVASWGHVWLGWWVCLREGCCSSMETASGRFQLSTADILDRVLG